MSNENVQVRVTADATGVRQGMQQARDAVAQALAAIKASVRDMRSEVLRATQSVRDETTRALGDMRQQAVESVRGMAGSFGGLVEMLASTRAGLIGVVVAVGLLAGSKLVASTADMTETSRDLGRALGVTTNEVSQLRAAFADEQEFSEFAGAAQGLAKQLRTNEEALRAMGLATRDADGNFRPLVELTTEAIGLVGEFADGTDRSVAMQTLFGKAMDASSRALLFNQEALQAGRDAASDLGLEVGQNSVAAWKAFDDASDRAGLGLKGLGKAIGDALMPVITDLLRLFNAAMPAAIAIARGALGGLTAAFLFAKNGVVVLWETIGALVSTVYEPLKALATAMWKALTGDWKGAQAELTNWPQKVADAWGSAFDRMTEMSEETSTKVAALFMPDTAPGDTGASGGTRRVPVPPPKSDGKAPPSQMAAFEAELEGLRVTAAEKDAIRGMEKAAELQFWQDKLKRDDLSEADRIAITRKAAQVRLGILQQEAREREQLRGIAAGQQQAWDLHEIEMEAEMARQRVTLGEMSQEELLRAEMGFEERRAAIKRQALMDQLALVDPAKDPVKLAQLNAQLEQQEMAHQQRMAQLRGQVLQQSVASQQALWQDLVDRMSGLWDKGVNAMMNGTLTWRNAQKAIGMEMVGWLAGIVKKQVATWVLGENAKSGATAAGTMQRWAMESWAAAKSVALWAATAVKNIMTSAWEAMAGAWKAMVGIPVIGPALGVAAGAAAFAGVSALAGRVASASGGYDIPAGVNPLTQLHEKEMVLPAKHAEVIRNLADNGGGGGGAGGGGEIKIEVRGSSAGDFFLMHRAELARALRAAARGGQFAGVQV